MQTAQQVIGTTAGSSMTATNWYEHVHVDPRNSLVLKPNERTDVMVMNNSSRRISYKVKTTRYNSVMPNRTYGYIDPKKMGLIKVAYQPGPHERRLGKSDRLTLLLKPIPDPNTSPEKMWSEEPRRFVLHLQQNRVRSSKKSSKAKNQGQRPKSKKVKSQEGQSRSKRAKSQKQRSKSKDGKSPSSRIVLPK